MNKLFVAILAGVILGCTPPPAETTLRTDPVSEHFDKFLKPFYHGVASGDPLTDRVILWTRVTPMVDVDRIPVRWEIAETSDMEPLLKSDTLSATRERDYTVKVDVDGLQPGKIYYYRFFALDTYSRIGRTKTVPSDARDSLQFAVVSCANWEWGYFSPYEKIAFRDDVDAVLHLGDFLYEYSSGRYGDTTIRKNLPKHEIVSLEDYRTRYSLYRTDRGLRLMSQQHPMIAIWDDHEIANDAYSEGAQNHQPDKEGEYQLRKATAKRVYYEWLPIRESEKLYRNYSYGTLADLFMLDERLEGRTKPADSITAPNYNSDDRAMLGKEQLDWIKNKLTHSKATWKVLGNQVIFSDIYYTNPKRPRNLDAWDGYPAEKKNLGEFLVSSQIEDLVIITGDSHSSWAIEVATDVPKTYNAKTSKGAFAVEFGTTSVTSANQDESAPVDTVKVREQKILKRNPHIKFYNARDHGYLLLTLYPTKARAQWYYMENLRDPDTKEYLAKTFEVNRGTVHLVEK